MTKLQQLFAEYGQSPWLDDLTRPYLRDGTLARMVTDGIRGVTANPTIFARAIKGSDDYDDQFRALSSEGRAVPDAYWSSSSPTSETPAPRRARRSMQATERTVAQAKLAYQLFGRRFSGGRWERLADRGARVQRLLWATTSPKNPAHPDTLYVDGLIGPDTVNTLPEVTVGAFEAHGRLTRTLDTDVDDARDVMSRLAVGGVEMDDVGLSLEDQGVSSFSESFRDVLGALDTKAHHLVTR
jgi:transaldolase